MIKLGLDTYSLRWQGWDAFQLLDYAASLGLTNVHFSERTALASLDIAYLQALRQRAATLGLSIELGMLSFDRSSSCFRAEYGSGEQQLADLVRAAYVVGSPIVRCVLGAQGLAAQLLPRRIFLRASAAMQMAVLAPALCAR